MRRLDFRPLKPWPDCLAIYVWRNEVLVGFQRPSEAPAVEIAPETPLAIALKAVHPSLTLPELARLVERVRAQSERYSAADLNALVLEFSYSPSAHLFELLEVLAQTPDIFQDQVSKLGLSAGELAPLRSLQPARLSQTSIHLEQLAFINSALANLVVMQTTRSQTAQMLELFIDLLWLDHPLSEVQPRKNEVAADFIQRLDALRKPLATIRDQSASEKVKQLPWPQSIQAKWLRQGDRGLIEVRFQVSSTDDFQKKIELLKRVQETSTQVSPWNN